MGTTERREREKQYRRNSIIDAAETLFFSKGFETTTMDEVAEEAEFSKGTLYLYFKNKDDLYAAINARGLKILADLFQKAYDKGGNGAERARRIGEAYHHFYRAYKNYFDVMLVCEAHGDNVSDTEADENGARALEVVAKAIAYGHEDGTIRQDLDPMETAVMLWGQNTGILQVAYGKGDYLSEHFNMDIEALLEHTLDFQMRSLKSKTGDSK